MSGGREEFAANDAGVTGAALPGPSAPQVEAAVRRALEEDLGRAGDITSAAVIPAEAVLRGAIIAREGCVTAGLGVARDVFRRVDPEVRVDAACADGAQVEPGESVLRVEGCARSILTAERTALNFLGRLSGVATATARLVAAAGSYPVRIADTRKTTPGLRALEKHAVRAGGGSNHRFGLDDAVLIKDNHIVAAGGVASAVRRARAGVGHLVKIEVEVDTLEQLAEALEAGPDAVLLDNMSPEQLREAVGMVAGRAVTEASGGISPETVAAVAETGVDVISVGWITHSARCIDFSLDAGTA